VGEWSPGRTELGVSGLGPRSRPTSGDPRLFLGRSRPRLPPSERVADCPRGKAPAVLLGGGRCARPRPRRSRWATSTGGTAGGGAGMGHGRRRGRRMARGLRHARLQRRLLVCGHRFERRARRNDMRQREVIGVTLRVHTYALNRSRSDDKAAIPWEGGRQALA
jgi:hypothetical protein